MDNFGRNSFDDRHDPFLVPFAPHFQQRITVREIFQLYVNQFCKTYASRIKKQHDQSIAFGEKIIRRGRRPVRIGCGVCFRFVFLPVAGANRMRILLDGRLGLIDAYVRGQFCEFLGGDGVAAREILFVAENSAGIAVIQNYPGLFWREAEPDELFQGCRVGIESEKRVVPGFPAFAGLGRFAG